jgi:hypothetical protein
MLAKTAAFIACSLNAWKKGFVEGNLVESDPAHYALSAAFKGSFGTLADRPKPRGSVDQGAFGPNGDIPGLPPHVCLTLEREQPRNARPGTADLNGSLF